MIDIADTAVTGVRIQHSGGFDGPFDAAAMASSSVGHTGRVFRRRDFLASDTDLLNQPRSIPSTTAVFLHIGVLRIDHRCDR